MQLPQGPVSLTLCCSIGTTPIRPDPTVVALLCNVLTISQIVKLLGSIERYAEDTEHIHQKEIVVCTSRIAELGCMTFDGRRHM